MKRAACHPEWVLSIALLIGVAGGGTGSAGEPIHDIRLPAETARLTPSPLPGYEIATRKCGICHSADYISLQPPHMSLTQWTAEMVKMQHAYAAPIDDSEIRLLSVYLASTYGDAASVPAAEMISGSKDVASQLEAPAVGQSNIDVRAVLDRNACLSCHSLQQKAVGPAYHEVAVKYAGDSRALGAVEASIRMGGSGKWGDVAMPPFANLSTAELNALAAFVLAQ
jgi:cytochrome c551/c552